MSRRNRISEEGQLVQSNLFAVQNSEQKRFDPYPALHSSVEKFREILYSSEGPLGVDFEFPFSYKATHFGIASETDAVCVRATPELVNEVCDDIERRGRSIVGHSVLGAERKVIEVMTGRRLALPYFDDSMLSHHLLNADLCSAPGKEEDSEEKGSLGFMGLGTMAHVSTLLPAWKICCGRDCTEYVCPTHNKSNYCAVDAWASLVGHNAMMEEMQTYGVSHEYYVRKHVLSEIALAMQEQGIKIDREYVKQFDAESEEKKISLFPSVMKGKVREFKYFNPRSSDQILKYFADNGIRMETTDKKVVRKMLEKQAEKHGFADINELDTAENLPAPLENLWKLDLFKGHGKGLKPWFDDKYLDEDGFAHPRFVTTGTSTDRWSSSKPNFTNIPVRGAWGALVKQAVVPRDPSLEIADADASQLELRMCLFLAGMDPKDIPPKAFEYIVEKSNGGFDKAAEIMQDTPRQVAKSFTHGGNYMETFQLLKPSDFSRPNMQSEIAYGARRVYLKKYGAPFDWEFRGQVVSFTGVNIAERIFGDKTYESRRKALLILEDVYMASFPMIRLWQKSVLEQVERDGFVRSPFSRRFLRLYGTDEECAKVAIAYLGQGVSAEWMQGTIVRYWQEFGQIPLIHVHDSICIEFPKEWTDKRLAEHFTFMFEPNMSMPDFCAPGKIKRGPTYGQMKDLVVM